MIKYFFIALIGLIFDYLILFLAVNNLMLNPIIGATLGFVLGLIINYYLTNKYIFKNPLIKSNYFNFIAYAFIGIVGLIILNISMFIQVEFYAINYLFAKSLSTIVVYFWNYTARAKLYREIR